MTAELHLSVQRLECESVSVGAHARVSADYLNVWLCYVDADMYLILTLQLLTLMYVG